MALKKSALPHTAKFNTCRCAYFSAQIWISLARQRRLVKRKFLNAEKSRLLSNHVDVYMDNSIFKNLLQSFLINIFESKSKGNILCLVLWNTGRQKISYKFLPVFQRLVAKTYELINILKIKNLFPKSGRRMHLYKLWTRVIEFQWNYPYRFIL